MVDRTEVEALKASFRGALRSAEHLAVLAPRLEALDGSADPDAPLLDEIGRLSAAHAVAAAALRGLVETMRARRERS